MATNPFADFTQAEQEYLKKALSGGFDSKAVDIGGALLQSIVGKFIPGVGLATSAFMKPGSKEAEVRGAVGTGLADVYRQRMEKEAQAAGYAGVGSLTDEQRSGLKSNKAFNDAWTAFNGGNKAGNAWDLTQGLDHGLNKTTTRARDDSLGLPELQTTENNMANGNLMDFVLGGNGGTNYGGVDTSGYNPSATYNNGLATDAAGLLSNGLTGDTGWSNLMQQGGEADSPETEGGLTTGNNTSSFGGLGDLFGNIFGGGGSGSSGLGGILGSLFGAAGSGGLSDLFSSILGKNAADDNYDDIKNISNSLDGIKSNFAIDSPYAKNMQASLDAKDAAAGRRSQYGTRAVELAGNLASKNADMDQAIARNKLAAAAYMGSQRNAKANASLGAATSLFNGIGSLFGNKGGTTVNNNTGSNGSSGGGSNGLGSILGAGASSLGSSIPGFMSSIPSYFQGVGGNISDMFGSGALGSGTAFLGDPTGVSTGIMGDLGTGTFGMGDFGSSFGGLGSLF